MSKPHEFTPAGHGAFSAKLHTMRKSQEFVIYPRKDGEDIYIQGDKACGKFRAEDGMGYFTTKSNRSHMLHTSLGAVLFTLPAEILTYCKEHGYRSGDTIGGGVVVLM